MSTRRFAPVFLVVAALAVLVLVAPAAQAQATRTWVSGVGDDANPCSRTAPCKTFAGAISKTAANGEISALDPGGYGAVTITKAITINGDGTLAGILASLTNGVIVNAGVNDVITLRSISINGAGNGLNGIRYLAGKQLIVENVTIRGFTTHGIDMNVTGSQIMQLRNVRIDGVANGISVTSSTVGQRASVNWDGGAIMGGGVAGTTIGVRAFTRSNVSLRNVTISGATTGVQADGSTTEVNIDDALLTQNATGLQTLNGGTARFSNTAFYTNGKAIDNGGTCNSFVNNRFAGNPTANTGAACTTTPGQQ